MSWQTKEDVLDDLSEVMGNEIKELDEQYILIGEQPPPLPCTSNETDRDEIYLRLNEVFNDKIINDDSSGPDLPGITEMLRMVDQYHCSNNLENDGHWLQNNGSNGISIVKLNVDVPEFTPKNDICNKNGIENRNKENNNVKNIDNETQTRMNVDAPEFIPKNDKCHESAIENRNKESNDAKINDNNITQTRIISTEETIGPAKFKEISDKLKAKIINPSKTTCLKKKIERNLAIASLLKLYSNAPVPDEKPPKLITPEHFPQTGNSKLCSENSSENSQKKVISPGPSLQANKVEDAVEITMKVNSTDQVVEESVAKVNSWLNEGITKKPSVIKESALYLGPITFKKKEVKKPKTSNPNTSKMSQNRIAEKSFVPSEYASTLTQSYMDRVKAKEDKTLDIWGKLERELKTKDKEIIAKRQQQLSVEVPQKKKQFISKLTMSVKQLNTPPDTVSVGAESIIKIRKVNAEHKANNAISINMHDKFKMPKEKRQKNVALASILEAIEIKNHWITNLKTVLLLKV